MPIQEATTTTAILEPEAEAPTTYTARVPLPTGSLLDRLTRNKPGIWGNKAFYVGLAVLYVVLLVLFFRLLLRTGPAIGLGAQIVHHPQFSAGSSGACKDEESTIGLYHHSDAQ